MERKEWIEVLKKIITSSNALSHLPQNVVQEVEALQSAIAEAEHEGELQTVLDAWFSIFGTNQLTHAQARLEAAEKKASKLEGIKKFLSKISGKGAEMLKICEQENFIFDNLKDRWQKLAFTFYSEIVQLSSEAEAIREEIG